MHQDCLVLPKSPDTPVYGKGSPRGKTRLRLLSKKRNAITDTEAWLLKCGATEPTVRTLPPEVPQTFQGAPAAAFIPATEPLALYGAQAWEPRYLLRLGSGEGTEPSWPGFDFGKWQRGGKFLPVVYADVVGEVLYVSTALNGYAREVGGKTGYVSALDSSGKLLWHAGPRLANARNFLVLKDVLICGYGFTQEPDALFVLDRKTGRTLQKLPLASAPELLHSKNGQIFVRCYDTDYIFKVT